MAERAPQDSRGLNEGAHGARLPDKVERQVKLARGALAVERGWRAFFPAFAVAAAFVIAALLTVPQSLHWTLHALLLLAVLAGLYWTLRGGFRAFRPPTRADALKRLEADGKLDHRPLATLEDELPEGSDDPLTVRLWQRHRERVLAGLGKIRPSPPRSHLPRVDRWALRAFIPLLLVVGVVAAGDSTGQRLLAALWPSAEARTAASVRAAEASLWVDPPVFSRLPPLAFDASDSRGAFDAPEDSEALLQVQGQGAPEARLTFNGRPVELTPLGPQSAEARFDLHESGDLRVTAQDGRVVRAWSVTLLGDEPPVAELPERPARTQRDSLAIVFKASDDYGVVGLRLMLRAPEGQGGNREAGPAEAFPLAAPAEAPPEVQGRTFKDFTRHPRAGLPTEIWLEAEDARGQVGESEPVVVVLPERLFTDPLAQDIIEQRKRLAEGADADQVAEALERLAERAAEREDLNAAVPLALGSAADRLRQEQRQAALPREQGQQQQGSQQQQPGQQQPQAGQQANPQQGQQNQPRQGQRQASPGQSQIPPPAQQPGQPSSPQQDQQQQQQQQQLAEGERDGREAPSGETVPELMYDTALFVEEGTTSMAEQRLRNAQDALERALAEGAEDAELQELMEELEQAMQEYLDALNEQMMEAMRQGGQKMQPVPMPPGSEMVERDQLQRMLDQAREMMEAGARDAARQMLSELRQMLENLQAGVPQMQMGPQQQSLQDLQRMMQLQQNLIDQSFAAQQQMQQGGQSSPQQGQQPGDQQQGQQPGQGQPRGMAGNAVEQDALRRALGELMRRMGENGQGIPGSLGQSELRMRDARDALQGNQPGQAMGSQGEALDLMRQAGQAMVEEMQQQMMAGQGQGQGQGQPMPGGNQAGNWPGEQPGRDPLGRDMPGGYGYDTGDVDVPDNADLGRAREVLDELRRRTIDRARPQRELEYYDRLLDRF